MYSNTLFDQVQNIVADTEILAEIRTKFRPFDRNLIINSIPGGQEFSAQTHDPIIASIANLPNQIDIAEAIIEVIARPALLIQDGEVEMPVSHVWQDRLRLHWDKITAGIPAVGRIEIKNHVSYPWVGTGWIVEEDILVTNRHVARVFAGQRENDWVFLTNHHQEELEVYIDFKEEFQRRTEQEIRVVEVLYIAPSDQPDLALLRIDRPRPSLSLQEQCAEGALVATIGYPGVDHRHTRRVLNPIFNQIYSVKRFQPGIKTKQVSDQLFHHDCSTLKGNSGSPVIDIHTGKAVGLHFGGRYKETNYAVEASHLMEILENLS